MNTMFSIDLTRKRGEGMDAGTVRMQAEELREILLSFCRGIEQKETASAEELRAFTEAAGLLAEILGLKD